MQEVRKFVSENKGLFLVFALFLILELVNVFKARGILWDEAVYIGLGKSFFSLGSIGLYESFRPVAIPLINGFFWKIGLDPFISRQVFAVISSIALIFMTYLVAKDLFGKKTAFFSAMILAISPVFIQNSSLVLVDIPSAVVLLSALYAFMKNKHLIAGLLSALAIIVKFPHLLLPMAFFAGFAVYAIMNKKIEYKRFLHYFSGFAIGIAPYLIFNYLMSMNDVGTWWHAVLRPFIFAQQALIQDVIWTQGTGFLYYVKELFFHNYLIIFGAAGLGACIARKDFKKSNYLMLLVMTVAYLVYFSVQTHKEYRYAVIFLPLIAIFAGHGFDVAIKHKNWIRIAAFAILFLALFNAVKLDVTQKYEFPNTIEFYKLNMPADSKIILTSDPVPAALFDKKVIPYYFNPIVGSNLYDADLQNADTVIFSRQSFYCQTQACEDALDLLEKKVRKNRLIAEEVVDGQKIAIFSTSS